MSPKGTAQRQTLAVPKVLVVELDWPGTHNDASEKLHISLRKFIITIKKRVVLGPKHPIYSDIKHHMYSNVLYSNMIK